MLVLELSGKSKSVALANIPKLNATIALEYAGKTKKTLVRDINQLLRMGLVEETVSGYRACKDLVFAFLPRRRRVKTASAAQGKQSRQPTNGAVRIGR